MRREQGKRVVNAWITAFEVRHVTRRSPRFWRLLSYYQVQNQHWNLFT